MSFVFSSPAKQKRNISAKGQAGTGGRSPQGVGYFGDGRASVTVFTELPDPAFPTYDPLYDTTYDTIRLRALLASLLLLLGAYITLKPAKPSPKATILNPRAWGIGDKTSSKFNDVCIIRGKVVTGPVCTPPTDIDEALERKGDN